MEKRMVGKSRKKDEDEQLSAIIILKIMFRFFDGLGLFSLPTSVAFYIKKESGLIFSL